MAAPMRAAASRSRREWSRCGDARACVVAQPSVQHLRARRSSDEQALCPEAAALVSRRTAPRTTHGLPAERLRDDGSLGPGTRKTDASVLHAASKQAWIEAELVSKKAAIATLAILHQAQKYRLRRCDGWPTSPAAPVPW